MSNNLKKESVRSTPFSLRIFGIILGFISLLIACLSVAILVNFNLNLPLKILTYFVVLFFSISTLYCIVLVLYKQPEDEFEKIEKD